MFDDLEDEVLEDGAGLFDGSHLNAVAFNLRVFEAKLCAEQGLETRTDLVKEDVGSLDVGFESDSMSLVQVDVHYPAVCLGSQGKQKEDCQGPNAVDRVETSLVDSDSSSRTESERSVLSIYPAIQYQSISYSAGDNYRVLPNSVNTIPISSIVISAKYR